MSALISVVVGFFIFWIGVPIALALTKALGVYTTVEERRCKVYVLFGKVIGILNEPGLHVLWLKIGPQVALVPLFGKVYQVDMRLDQEYLRSQPVNSEEGAPMGIGIWYGDVCVQPSGLLVQECGPAWKHAGERQQCRSSVSVEHAADGHAGNPPR